MKVSKVKQHITTLYKAGCRHTIFLVGSPGIGKSEVTSEAAKELGIGYRQWQATIEDPLELPGLPAVKDGKAYRAPFEDKIPSDGAGILCIDEINSASSLTQCSLYSLIWDKKLGGSILGKDWIVIATGNQDKDRAVTQRIPTPLVSRMEHLLVEPDLDSWMTYMALRDGHPSVRAFIKTRSELFVNFKADVPGPFACPRTWTMVSEVMKAYGKETPPFESIAGWVAEGPATEFLQYHMMAIDLVDPESIIKDPTRAAVPSEPGQLYALTTALAGKMNYQNTTPIITWLNRIPIEYSVYCIASARDVEKGRMVRMSPDEKTKYKKIEQNQTFRDWCLKHNEIVR